MSTITPPSNTAPGTAQQQFFDVLRSIQGTPTPIGDAAASAQSQALAMQSGQQDFTNQTQQNLTQQSGIPQLQTSYGDLSKVFDMYLHDQGLASQYGGQNTNPYANAGLIAAGQTGNGQVGGSATSAPNPYLAPVDQLLASSQGAVSPAQTTAMMGAPVSGTVNLMNTLLNSITGQTNLVNKQTDLSVQNYQSKMNALSNLGSILGNAFTAQQNQATSSTGLPGSKKEAGVVFQGIVDNLQKVKGAQTTETDVWNYIDQHQAALANQGVDINELWRLHKDLADKVNQAQGVSTGGLLEGGKPLSQKEQDAASAKIGAIKAFGSLVQTYYDGTTQVNPNLRVGHDLNMLSQWNSMKDLYLGGVSKQLGISRSNVRFEDLKQKMPGGLLGIGAEGSFRGHLSTLLSISDLVIVMDKKTNPDGTHDTGVIPRRQFNKETEVEIKPTDQSIPFDEIRQIIGGLQ